MADHTPGEHVRILIDDARVEKMFTEGHGDDVTPMIQVTIADSSGVAYYLTLPCDWPGVTIERVAPPEWPPQPGDLWRDRNGSAWFATDLNDIAETGDPEIAMVLAYEDFHQPPDAVNKNKGPLTLVHREEANGDG
jgi:hypothetical protein